MAQPTTRSRCSRDSARGTSGHVRVVELSRNFGQHSAILAGFKQSRGEIVVTLDADLQNPPEEIPRLIAAIDEGNDVVGGWREERQDQAFRRIASRFHNKLTSAIVGVPMHDYGCMLRAYRRHIVDTVVECDEKAAFVPALANSFAKRVAEIPVGHAERASGASKYNMLRLATLSLNLITGFSMIPIQILSLMGYRRAVPRCAAGAAPRVGHRLILRAAGRGRVVAAVHDSVRLCRADFFRARAHRRVHRSHLPGSAAPSHLPGAQGARR